MIAGVLLATAREHRDLGHNADPVTETRVVLSTEDIIVRNLPLHCGGVTVPRHIVPRVELILPYLAGRQRTAKSFKKWSPISRRYSDSRYVDGGRAPYVPNRDPYAILSDVRASHKYPRTVLKASGVPRIGDLFSHRIQLRFGGLPLKARNDQPEDRNQGTQRGADKSKQHLAVKLLYLRCLLSVGASLCGVAAWFVWRFANIRSVAAAFGIYLVVAAILWHGFRALLSPSL
jgi:hypothetical protein